MLRSPIYWQANMIILVIVACVVVATMELWIGRNTRTGFSNLDQSIKGIRSEQSKSGNTIGALEQALHILQAKVDKLLGATDAKMKKMENRLEGIEERRRETSELLAELREALRQASRDSSEQVKSAIASARDQFVRIVEDPLLREREIQQKYGPGSGLRGDTMAGVIRGADAANKDKVINHLLDCLSRLGLEHLFSAPPQYGSWLVRFYFAIPAEDSVQSFRDRLDTLIHQVNVESYAQDVATQAVRDLMHTISQEPQSGVQIGPLAMVQAEQRSICVVLDPAQLDTTDFGQLLQNPESAITALEALPGSRLDPAEWARAVSEPGPRIDPGVIPPGPESPHPTPEAPDKGPRLPDKGPRPPRIGPPSPWEGPRPPRGGDPGPRGPRG